MKAYEPPKVSIFWKKKITDRCNYYTYTIYNLFTRYSLTVVREIISSTRQPYFLKICSRNTKYEIQHTDNSIWQLFKKYLNIHLQVFVNKSNLTDYFFAEIVHVFLQSSVRQICQYSFTVWGTNHKSRFSYEKAPKVRLPRQHHTSYKFGLI